MKPLYIRYFQVFVFLRALAQVQVSLDCFGRDAVLITIPKDYLFMLRKYVKRCILRTLFRT